MVINKDITNATPVSLNISNVTVTGSAQVWQLANGSISQLANTGVTNGVLNQMLPSQSITLFVVPGVLFSIQVGGSGPPGYFQLLLNGRQNQSYILQSSTDLNTWQTISTNVLASNSFSFFIPTTNAGGIFYRAAIQMP
jgi:hypothetical protein